MNWSFVIITDGRNPEDVWQNIKTIFEPDEARDHWHRNTLNEIIVVGGQGFIHDYIKHIPFDETKRPAWITRKKNLGVLAARNHCICLMHDYYRLEPGWFTAWDNFGSNWDVAVNKIVTVEGARHSDWLINPEYMQKFWRTHSHFINQVGPVRGEPKYHCGLPYDVRGLEPIQYVSGGYMCVQKHLIQVDVPLNERLTWGQDEDVEWSQAVNLKHKVVLNPGALVTANRPDKWKLDVLPLHVAAAVGEFYGLDMHLVNQT